MAKALAMLLLLSACGGASLGLAGCEDAAHHTASYYPPAPSASPAGAAVSAGASSAGHSQGQIPAPASKFDSAEAVAKRAQAAFAAAEQEYQAGHADASRQGFDQAIDILLDSGIDLQADPQVAQLLNRIIETAHNDALEAFQDAAGANEAKSEPAPIDEIESLAPQPAEGAPAPVDPQLRTRAEGELADVAHDLPLTVNDIVLSYLNFFQTPHGRAIVETGLERAGRYRAMIERVLAEEGLPSDLMYIAQAESAFQPQALSRAGARGLWQFMSYRGKQYGLKQTWWVDDRQDPEKATQAAAHHLHDLYDMFGDWYLVMAAYNSGPGTVQHAVERTGYADFWQLYKLNVLPQETKNYVPIILALTLIAKDPARYGIDVEPEEPVRADRVQPGHPIDLRLVADTIDVDVDTLRALNPELLRLTTPDDPSFVLQLPEGTGAQFTAAMADIPADKWLSWRRHRVEDGETLSSVAQQYRVSASALADTNELEIHAALEPGTKLIIPVAPRAETSLGKLVRYRVRQSDTLQSIADEFDVTVPELKKWNRLRGNQIPRGTRLRIYPEETGAVLAESSHSTASGSPKSETATVHPATSAVVRQKRTQTAAVLAAHSAVSHRVKPGETLYSIARAYQTTEEALRSGNKFLLGRPLEAGDILMIPR